MVLRQKIIMLTLLFLYIPSTYTMMRLNLPIKPNTIIDQRKEKSLLIALHMLQAVISDDIERVTQLLKHDFANINHRYTGEHYCDYTLLMFATERNNKPMCEFLLKNGAHINTKSYTYINGEDNAISPINFAIFKNLEELVALFIQHGAHLHATEIHSTPPLHCAVLNGNKNLTQMILNAGADINARDLNMATALHIATFKNNVSIVELLLDYDANPNIHDIDGQTPLGYAKEHNETGIICSLMLKGAHFPITQEEEEEEEKYNDLCDHYPISLEFLKLLQSQK